MTMRYIKMLKEIERLRGKETLTKKEEQYLTELIERLDKSQFIDIRN